MEHTNQNLPILALRGLTIFPGCILSFDVEREISIRALERAMESDQRIFLVAQREAGVQIPGEDDPVRCGHRIRGASDPAGQRDRRPGDDGGPRRARLRRLWQSEPYLQGNVELLAEGGTHVAENHLEALLRQTYTNFNEYASQAPRMNGDVVSAVLEDRDPGHLADFIAQNIPLRHQDKQAVLEELRPVIRLRKVNELLAREAEVLSCEQELEGKIRRQLGQVQRDHIIREQIRLLQQELGEDENSELDEYRTGSAS